jgi:hypothetical protein
MASVRTMAVWTLLAYTTLALVFAFVEWFGVDQAGMALPRGSGFLNVINIAVPITAVLVAAYAGPRLPVTRLAARIALAQYALMVGCGGLALVLNVPDLVNPPGADFQPTTYYIAYYVSFGLAELALGVVAALATWRVLADVDAEGATSDDDDRWEEAESETPVA